MSMITDTTANNMKWRMKSIHTPLSHIPAKPGLYAIGHLELINGLEKGRIYVYIGQTGNLRRRLNEHSVLKETKKELKRYLKDNHYRAKCWYTTEVDSTKIRNLESELIEAFDPKYNDKK